MDYIFDGRSSCLLDYRPTVSDGECEIPTHIVYVVEKSATSTGSGWICEYYNKAKCVDLNETPVQGGEVGVDKIQIKQRPPSITHTFGHKSNQWLRNAHRQIEHAAHLLDFVDADFNGDDYLDWGEEEEEDEEPDRAELEDEKDFWKIYRMDGDGRVNYSKFSTKTIDAIRYYVFVIPMRDRVQILWKRREMDDNLSRYKKDVHEIQKIPGCRKLHTGRTTKRAATA